MTLTDFALNRYTMPRCYNCGSPYHYSDNCPNPSKKSARKDVTCYKCGQPGHYSDKCNNSSSSSSSGNKNVVCYKCGKPGHYSDKCISSQSSQSSVSSNAKNEIINYNTKYKLVLKLQGKWGSKSAFIHPDSEFFKVKKALGSMLIEMEGISEADFDIRNDVPHIELAADGDEKQFDAAVEELEGREFVVSLNAFQIRDDSISFDVGQNKHITLFYKKDLLKIPSLSRAKIQEILQSVLSPFTIEKDPEEGKEHNVKNDKIACIVCMENDVDCQISPCGHASTCMSCCTRLNFCPSCRGKINSRTKIYIQHA
jgi:Zinc finger, C3HC4 type (RING finger)/Zinc knuckle